MRAQPFNIAGVTLAPGESRQVAIPAARLYTDTPIDIVVEVLHGRRSGPVLMVCAALHGDEINGVDICRRLRHQAVLRRLRGTLLVVPIINVFGFIQQTRYLPDRRDLNRCFPGSPKGTLGSRLAYLIRTELLAHCTHVIDLHTAAVHRDNLPQIRGNLEQPVVLAMAQAFGAPVILDSRLRDGSLRAAAHELDIPLIIYEAGEALRFSEAAVRAGLRGVLRVMRYLHMLPGKLELSSGAMAPVVAAGSRWLRADKDGMLISHVGLGQRVRAGEVVAHLVVPFQAEEVAVISSSDGIIIGRAQIPLVNEGEALFHIAEFSRLGKAADSIEAFNERYDNGLPRLSGDAFEPLTDDT